MSTLLLVMKLDLREHKSRQNLTFGWLAISIAWSAIRSFVVGEVFSPHGTDADVYFLIDLLTTIPYAIFSAKAVFAAIDKSSKFFIYALIAGIAFITPDVYIFGTAKQVSTAVWIEFITYVFVMAGLAVTQSKKSRKTY